MVLPQRSLLKAKIEENNKESFSESILKDTQKSNHEREMIVNKLLEDNFNRLKFAAGVDYLSSEVLLKAPKNYFNKYDEFVKDTVAYIQEDLSKRNESNIIRNSKENPTNKEIQKSTIMTLGGRFIDYTGNNVHGRAMLKHLKTKEEKDILKALVINELIGLGPLEPLWNDTRITEIICNGPYDIQVEIEGNIHKVESCHFRDPNHLQNLIDVLYSSIDKQITRTNPMERGRLSDNSRMMAVHRIVAPDGPNFNIRRHSEAYWGPNEVLRTDTADIPLLTYLGNLIYNGISFLVVGGTGTGKTTLLDALTAYFRNDERIVTLEDNLEMKPHPRKLFSAPMECVDGKPGSLNEGGITMRDLVHASLQMRPEAIIIGEVTDGAAYDLCQALNTGHSGASTVHANDADASIYRLMSLVSQSGLIKGKQAYDLIASAFDIIITVERFPIDGSRKITSVNEVGNKVIRDKENNEILPTRKLWQYTADKDSYQMGKKVTGKWEQVNNLSDYTIQKHHLDLKTPKTWEELKNIAKL